MMLYLSIGTNLGNRQDNLREACDFIQQRVGSIVRQSSIYETEPVGFESDNKFLNMCVAVDTNIPPLLILDITQEIERCMGRTQKSTDGHYHDRIIDIDILLYGDLNMNTQRLVIPHPKMYERDFVMLPLSEILVP